MNNQTDLSWRHEVKHFLNRSDLLSIRQHFPFRKFRFPFFRQHEVRRDIRNSGFCAGSYRNRLLPGKAPSEKRRDAVLR